MSDMTDKTVLEGMLNTLCPMHAVLNKTGHIEHAGPALHKLLPQSDLIGMRFLELLQVKRPSIGSSMQDLRGTGGMKLHLKLRHPPCSELKGVLVPLPEAAGFGPPGGAIVNLSFGISVIDAVRDFSLTSADFAATDLTVEMLYLVEAKSAAMAASHKLNIRLQGAKIAAEEQAFTDTLTGLKNRRAMDHILDRLMQSEQEFALMNLDLDYFKAVNDNMGHAAGDHVLQHVARLMVEEIRGNDTVIRTGGDEFVLIFNNLSDRNVLAEIAGRMIAKLEQPIPFNGQECKISASIGAALSCDYNAPDIDQMMNDADVALYAAKDRGRACHVIYDATLRHARTAEAAEKAG
jgi:diguanylate cyclase (GGDEF)-like protein